MTLTAFLLGYPPFWSMGGEISTHRTLRVVPGSTVFTTTDHEYDFEGVTVRPGSGMSTKEIIDDAESVNADILFAHSTMSAKTVQAARRLKIPSILTVHAPPRFAPDLRRAWPSAKVRLYNTEAARKEWRDPGGWLLHPPVGKPLVEELVGPQDALTLTSSLVNKGAQQVLELAKRWQNRRFIIVRSPAHATHGAPDFEEEAGALENVEVWDRLHPDEMHLLWAETRVLLVPSFYETYGLSAVEAAWYGIPSVHVDTVHVREGIGTAARLIKSRKVEELESAIMDVEMNYALWTARAHSRAHEIAEREKRELAVFAANVARLAAP